MPIEIASAEEQYKKFQQLDRAEVLKLKEWQNTQPHLPEITEFEVITFLHASKYSVERAKVFMDTYYTIRTHCLEFFSKRDVFGADFTTQMNVSAVLPLQETTKKGHRVVIWKLTDLDPSKFVLVDVLKRFVMVADLWLAREGITKGYAVVLDMEGSTLSHLAKFNMITLKKFMYYIQEASPIRCKEFHFINTVPFVDKALILIRPSMKSELTENMHLHSSVDTFVDTHFPKSAMPDEYGGSAGKIKDIQAKVNQELQDNAQFFIDEETTKRVNEKLRLGKWKTESDLFGTEGNFKKLSID